MLNKILGLIFGVITCMVICFLTIYVLLGVIFIFSLGIIHIFSPEILCIIKQYKDIILGLNYIAIGCGFYLVGYTIIHY